jgi:hypothetical protein
VTMRRVIGSHNESEIILVKQTEIIRERCFLQEHAKWLLNMRKFHLEAELGLHDNVV